MERATGNVDSDKSFKHKITLAISLYKISLRARHTLNGQPYGRKVLSVQQYPRYDNFDSHPLLKTEPSIFLII
jgi:hypothetical protein